MGRKNPLNPVIIKDQQSDTFIPIPKFDDNLKCYLENRAESIWIYDCIRFKFIWGNTAAVFDLWGKKSLDHFISTDLSDQSEKTMLLNNMMLTECMKKQESSHPFTFYPEGKAPCKCVLQASGIEVNGELMLLGKVDSLVKPSKNYGDSSIVAMGHEAFKYCPSMMSVHRVDGTLLCHNVAAEAFFRKIFLNYIEEKEVDGGQAWLRTLMQGVDKNDDEFVAMMDAVLRGETYSGQIRVPPFAKDCEVWHSITVCKQTSPLSGEDILVVTQTDVSSLHDARRKLFDVENLTKEKQKDRLVQSVSHELKTPLVGVIGLSDALLENESLMTLVRSNSKRMLELEPVVQQLRAIRSSGSRLLELVNTLLDISRFKNGKLEIEWKKFDLKAEILSVILECESSGVTTLIKQDLGNKDCVIVGDPKCVRQVVQTLMSNALKFTKHGMINIKLDNRITHDGGCVIISVADQGIGIPEEDQERIFELFEQGDNSATREHAGAGVGLCLARQIVELHGGSIIVQSTVGVGSTFTFSLPYRADMLDWKPSVDLEDENNLETIGSVEVTKEKVLAFDRRIYEEDTTTIREDLVRNLCDIVEESIGLRQLNLKEGGWACI